MIKWQNSTEWISGWRVSGEWVILLRVRTRKFFYGNKTVVYLDCDGG